MERLGKKERLSEEQGGIILSTEKAKEALDEAKDANNSNLQLRNTVTGEYQTKMWKKKR